MKQAFRNIAIALHLRLCIPQLRAARRQHHRSPNPANHPVPAIQDTETPAQKDARMQWWREARFGMFIHWGLYSIPAGEWHGKRTPTSANGS